MRSASALLDVEEFTKQAAHYAPKVALAAVILLIGAIFVRVIRSAAHAFLRRTHLRPSAILFGARVGGVVAWAVVVTVVLSILQLHAVVLGFSGVLALIGAAFVASAAGISNDIISGFFLAADPDIDVGYRVITAGIEGVVHDIDFRKTRIVDDQGRLHVVPNRFVENGEWIVLGRG